MFGSKSGTAQFTAFGRCALPYEAAQRGK